MDFLDRDIDVREVLKAVSSLERDKAMGPDMIHNRFLKELEDQTWEKVTKVFNQCLRGGCTSLSIWNCSNTSPIPKPGKKLDQPKNFRPIAVSSCLGRILEKVMATRLQTFCVVNKIFSNDPVRVPDRQINP